MKRIYTLFISGLLLTLIVLYNLILWWAISTEKSTSFDQAKEAYLNRYPAFLADSLLLTLLSIVMSVTAGLCFFQIRQKSRGKLGLLSKVLAILHLILILWLVFTLM